jgi:hypothetical protein
MTMWSEIGQSRCGCKFFGDAQSASKESGRFLKKAAQKLLFVLGLGR